ncbi:MAG: hypothetical protein JXL97_17200 [Bacteroidales bacterium]|nr:hypothetical protein [Bacteroidales bacterium]
MKKTKKILSGILILAIAIITPLLFQNYSKKAKETADNFMQYAINEDFENAYLLSQGELDFPMFFNEEEKITSYEQSGFGINSINSVNIDFYVEGTPADQRNITLTLEKNEKKLWKVTSISVNYFILRQDKNFALDFVKQLSDCSNNNAFKMTNEVDFEDFNRIRDFICNNQKFDILMTNGLVIVCTKKNCPKNTTEAQFYFSVGLKTLIIDTYHQDDVFWIKNMKLN